MQSPSSTAVCARCCCGAAGACIIQPNFIHEIQRCPACCACGLQLEYLAEVHLSLEQMDAPSGGNDMDALRGIRVRPCAAAPPGLLAMRMSLNS
jgi:hypothetical protein